RPACSVSTRAGRRGRIEFIIEPRLIAWDQQKNDPGRYHYLAGKRGFPPAIGGRKIDLSGPLAPKLRLPPVLAPPGCGRPDRAHARPLRPRRADDGIVAAP